MSEPVYKPHYLQFSTNDMAATQTFYRQALGWEFTDYGPSYAGFNNETGGFELFEGDAHVPAQSPLVVLFAEDLEATQARIVKAGGRIQQEIYAFPGGRRFHFLDPANNELAVWSPE